MWIVSLISAAVIAGYAWRVVARRVGTAPWVPPKTVTPDEQSASSLGTERCGLSWKHITDVEYPAALVREAVIECFGKGIHMPVGPGTTDYYERGNWRASPVSSARIASLADIPSSFDVGVATIRDMTIVSMRITIDARVRIDRSVANQLECDAKAELSRSFERLMQTVARFDRRQHEDPRPSPPPTDCKADYAILSLKPGATWDQVHAAYRAACRLYHPDRLNGQNVEPHLVELAVQRFKEISAAYQRLKDLLGQPQHA